MSYESIEDQSSKIRIADYQLIRRAMESLRQHRTGLFLGVGLILLAQGAQALVPYMTVSAIEAIRVGTEDIIPKSQALYDLLLWCGLMGAVFVFSYVVSYVQGVVINHTGQKAMRSIRTQLFRHVFGFRMSFFHRYPSGRLVSRTVHDVEQLGNILTNGIVGIIGDGLTLVAIFIIGFFISWELSLAIFPAIIMMIITVSIFRKHARRAFLAIQGLNAKITGFLTETIQGIPILQNLGSEIPFKARFRDLNKQMFHQYQHTIHIYSLFFPINEIIQTIAYALILLAATVFIAIGWLFIEEAIGFLLIVYLFLRPLRQIAEQYNTMQAALASAEKIETIFRVDDTLPDDGTKYIAPRINSIHFDQVHFSYLPNEDVLKGIDIRIERGEHVAIVGSTGAGKSTFSSLLMRHYEPDRGSIRVNGIPLPEIKREDFRHRVAWIPQDVFLFAESILENIRLHNPDVTRESVIAAAKRVQADQYISKLPKKYDTVLHEEGIELSMGQRQLLAFARAMVGNPELIIFDEATASIDSETERLIEKTIQSFLLDRTAIIIAHRLSTIRTCDRILVFHKGRIHESGTHESLLKARSLYYQLHKLQYQTQTQT